MTNYWDKRGLAPEPVSQQPVELDEEAMKVFQEDPNVDIFEEEEEDIASIMSDANLRLEQGRLYQMVLQSNIFADTDADPRAIRNVHREIRKLAKEKMEVMLGIRQEQSVKETIISSPFNDMEVTVLKMLASRMSKGATEEIQKDSGPSLPPTPPKKDGITSISGDLRPQTTPLRKEAKPLQKSQSQPLKKSVVKSAVKAEEETLLQKPIDEMTPQELVEYEKAAAERRVKNKSALPTNMVPHPNAQQLEMLYTASASNMAIANPWRAAGQ